MPDPKLQTFSHPYISCAKYFESCLIQYFLGEGQPVLLIAVDWCCQANSPVQPFVG